MSCDDCPVTRTGFRSGLVLLASLTLVGGLAACTTTGERQAANGGATPTKLSATYDDCKAEVLADPQAYITKYTASRSDLAQVVVASTGKPLTSDAAAMEAITKGSMLPCNPKVTLSNLAAAPQNVRTVDGILGLSTWNKLVRTSIVGKGPAGGPPPTGFATGEESYTTFLNLVARYPFFCGEKGVWPTITEACTREIATMFAHAAQETGQIPPPAGVEPWQASLYYVREQTCYPATCVKYDTGKEAFGAPADAHFYGRGMKQVTYVYNYAGVSGAFYGDVDPLVKNPDLVAQDAELVLGSGLWFLMSAQPPKPSMHAVMIGTYQPRAAAAGIAPAADGSVVDKFSATVSIINGGIECSPTDSEAKTKSQARYTNFVGLLKELGATLTPVESSYVPGSTYCTIERGNPFALNAAALGYQPNFYYDTTAPGCKAIPWQTATPLVIASEGMLAACRKLSSESVTR